MIDKETSTRIIVQRTMYNIRNSISTLEDIALDDKEREHVLLLAAEELTNHEAKSLKLLANLHEEFCQDDTDK